MRHVSATSGPTRVGLGEVCRPSDRAGHGGQLTLLTAYVEGSGVGQRVKHRGHPVGEVLGFPYPRQRPSAVRLQQGRVVRGDRTLETPGPRSAYLRRLRRGGFATLGDVADQPGRAHGRYLSFAEREEIATLRAQDIGVCEIAHQIGRDPSTISRELRRNAATRAEAKDCRAVVAH